MIPRAEGYAGTCDFSVSQFIQMPHNSRAFPGPAAEQGLRSLCRVGASRQFDQGDHMRLEFA
ncbi:hypothetical protein SAMN05444050_1948 [Afipia sp. GAS231]|nr:hypothetical protein SAMN05444050_1948 [Afipia sp. GAS231]